MTATPLDHSCMQADLFIEMVKAIRFLHVSPRVRAACAFLEVLKTDPNCKGVRLLFARS
jgi:hypothetical protein